MNVHWRKSTSESERKHKQKFDAAFGTIFRIMKCFQKSKQKLHICFSVLQAKNKKPSAHVQKVLTLFNRPAKKYPSGDPHPLNTKKCCTAIKI
jgi:hypothetical protein